MGPLASICLQDELPGYSPPAHLQEAPSALGRGKEQSWDLTTRARPLLSWASVFPQVQGESDQVSGLLRWTLALPPPALRWLRSF